VQQSRSKRARRNPSPRMIKVTVHEKRRVNKEQPTSASSPSRNHDSAAPRQHPLICTGAEPIHQVTSHGPPKLRATVSMLQHRIHISAIFPPFSCVCVCVCMCMCVCVTFGELNSCELVFYFILMFLTPLDEVNP